MDNDSNNHAAPARSGQATGYATAVDAALAWADGSAETPPTLPVLAPLRRPTEATTECVARILAAEVRRLRAALDFRGQGGSTYNKLCQAIVALPCCPLSGLIGEAAQELAAHESHNARLTDEPANNQQTPKGGA